MTQKADIENVNVTKLEAIARKVFGNNLQDVRENIYSSICAEILVTAENVTMQDLETLMYYRIKPVIIQHKRTGFSIHIRTMWSNEKYNSGFEEAED